jgi:hypothetical protein
MFALAEQLGMYISNNYVHFKQFQTIIYISNNFKQLFTFQTISNNYLHFKQFQTIMFISNNYVHFKQFQTIMYIANNLHTYLFNGQVPTSKVVFVQYVIEYQAGHRKAGLRKT